MVDPLRGFKESREIELGTGELWTEYRSEQVTLINKTREAQVRMTSFRVARC